MIRETQADRILALLKAHEGQWVPLPRLMQIAAQYNARIYELRAQGHDIENRIRTDETGIVHSWYRLVAKKGQLELLKTA